MVFLSFGIFNSFFQHFYYLVLVSLFQADIFEKLAKVCDFLLNLNYFLLEMLLLLVG